MTDPTTAAHQAINDHMPTKSAACWFRAGLQVMRDAQCDALEAYAALHKALATPKERK